MKLTSLLQLVERLQQVGKIDNLQQVCSIFGCVCQQQQKSKAFNLNGGKVEFASLHIKLTNQLNFFLTRFKIFLQTWFIYPPFKAKLNAFDEAGLCEPGRLIWLVAYNYTKYTI